MTDTHLSNPAGRLWLMYNVIYEYSTGDNFRDTICTEQGIDSGDVREWLRVVSNTWEQIDEMRAAVTALGDPIVPKDELLNPVWAIQKVLDADPMGANNNAWVQNFLDRGVMAELRTASRVLSREVAQPVIDDDTLSKIMDLAAELVKVAASDESLDPDARALIVEYAQRISAAAAEYKLRGPGPLIAEFNRFMGATVHTPVPTRTPVGQRLWQLTNVLVLATSVFTAPVDFGNALEQYQQTMTKALPASVEAPGVVEGVIVDEEA